MKEHSLILQSVSHAATDSPTQLTNTLVRIYIVTIVTARNTGSTFATFPVVFQQAHAQTKPPLHSAPFSLLFQYPLHGTQLHEQSRSVLNLFTATLFSKI